MVDDCSIAPADLLIEITDVRRRLIDSRVGELRRLGYGRDIGLLFWNGDYCKPDFGLADVLGADVHATVCEIFDLSHEVAHAERELELRARPN